MLTSEQKAALLDVLAIWASEAGDGYDGLPDDIFGFGNALRDDLRDNPPAYAWFQRRAIKRPDSER